MSPSAQLNLLRLWNPPTKSSGVKPASLDPTFNQTFVQVEGDREALTPGAALVAGPVVEEHIRRRVETRPGDVLETMSKDIDERE